MRVSASVKKICRNCKIIRRKALCVLSAQTHAINSVKADFKEY